MNRHLVRAVTVLLLPSLLADPRGFAAVLSHEPSAVLQHSRSQQLAYRDVYKEEAFVSRLTQFPHAQTLNASVTRIVFRLEGWVKRQSQHPVLWTGAAAGVAATLVGAHYFPEIQNFLADHFRSPSTWISHTLAAVSPLWNKLVHVGSTVLGPIAMAVTLPVTRRAPSSEDFPSGVGVEYDGSTATILLKHGPVNTMTLEMIRDLSKVIDRIQSSSHIKAVIIKGVPEVSDREGNPIFGVGADITRLQNSIKSGHVQDADWFYQEEYKLYDRIAELHKTKPVVSLINGTAVGSQLGLAMTGLIVATKDAKLGMPETKIGFFPDVGATHSLPQRVGLATAKYLGLTGKLMNGTEAFRYGLADAFTSEYTLSDLEDAIKELAQRSETVTPDQMHEEISRFNVRASATIVPKPVLQKLFGAHSFESIVAALNAAIQYDQEQGKVSTEGKIAQETLAALRERSPIGLHITNELMNLNPQRTLALSFRKELTAAKFLSRHLDYVTGVEAFKAKTPGRPAFQGTFETVDYAQLSEALGQTVAFVDEAALAKKRKEGPYLIKEKGDWDTIETDFKRDPNAFWLRRGLQELEWFKKPTVGITENIDEEGHFNFTYFEDGELNASYELLDRQVKRGYGDNIAYSWIGDPADSTTGDPIEPVQTITYKELLRKVELFANALKDMGVKEGEGITLYTAGNTIEAKIARLAAMRIGAIFTPVFPGLAAQELSDRAAQIKTKVVLTVNGGYRQGELEKWKEEVVDRAFEDFIEKKDIDGYIRQALQDAGVKEEKWAPILTSAASKFKDSITVNFAEIDREVSASLAEGAIREETIAKVSRNLRDQTKTMSSRIEKMVVIERVSRKDVSVTMRPGRDVYFNDELARMETAGKTECPPLHVKAEHPLFVIFTSGTTGKPKGAYHTTAGYLTNVSYSFKFAWDVQPGDRYWVSADDGWITGNSAMSDGPLLNAGHSFLYEGLPNWPTEDRLWKMLSENKINYYKTGVTAIRNASKANPALVSKWDLSNLKGSASCAEPLYPDVQAFWDSVVLAASKWGAKVINVFWRTEDGIMSAFIPHPRGRAQKPDASTVASPWGQVKVLVLTKDDDGKIVSWRNAESGEPGSVFVRHHPSMIRGLWGDPDRFRDTYWPTQIEIDGERWHKAGDAGVMSEDGYITFLGRDDEVINTSGHRIGTQEIESLVVKVPEVKLAAVVGIPHLIKGETPVAFVIVKPGVEVTPDLDTKIRKMVEEGKGKIARPEEVFYVTDFPNTKSNKVLRRLLQQIAAMQSAELAQIYRAIQDPEIAEKLRKKDPETLAQILGEKVAKSVDTLPIGVGGTNGLLAAIRGVAEKREIGKVGRRELPIGEPNEIDFVSYLPKEVHAFVAKKLKKFRNAETAKRQYEMGRRWMARLPKSLTASERSDYFEKQYKAAGLTLREGRVALGVYEEIRAIRDEAVQKLVNDGLLWPLGKPFVPGLKLPPYMFAWAYVKDQWGRPVYGHPEDALYEIIAPTPRKPGPNEVVGYTLIAGITRNMVAAGEDLNVGGFNFHDQDYHISGSDGVFLTAEVGSETEKAGTTRLGDIFYDYSGEAGLLDPRMGFDPMATEDFKIKGYQTGDGTLAQFAIFQAPQVIIKPAEMTLEQAASHNLDQGTVLKSIMYRAETQLDEEAFVEGAAGGTGHLAVNVVDMLGARATGLVSSDERGRFAMEQGAKAYINRKDPRFTALWQPVPNPKTEPEKYAAWAAAAELYQAEYKRLNNDKLAKVINASVGGPTFASNVELLADGGRLVYYGADQGFNLSFRGKAGSRSAKEAFEKNKVEPGHGVLVYYRAEAGRQGIDDVGLEAIKEALRRRARVLVIAHTVEEQIYLQRRFGKTIGVESIENLKTGYPQFEWPDEMPNLDIRDSSGKATVDIDRRFHFQQHTLKIFGDVVKKFFKTDDNPAGSPEVVVERTGQNTLGVSAWLVRKMTGKVIYLEDTKDLRLNFYAPDVWFAMKTIDFPTFSILGTHLFNSFQAQKLKRLFEQGRLHIEPPNMFDWDEARQAVGTLADAKVQGTNAVWVAAPPVKGLKAYEGKDQIAAQWNQSVKGFGRTVKVTLYEIKPGEKAAVLSLESPGNFNVLNTTMVKNLKAAVDYVSKESGIRAVVITGSGKLFCGGADLKEMQIDLIDPNDGTELAREAQGVFDRIEALPFPVVAAMNGSALGGGMELAMSAHYRVASAKAEIGQPEITYRIIPGFGGTQRLPRLMQAKSGIQGIIDAAKIILNGRRFSALEAQRDGLVDEVAATDALSRALNLTYQYIQTGQGPLAAAQASRHQTIQDWNQPKSLAPGVIEKDSEIKRILRQSEKVGRGEAVQRALAAIYHGYEEGIQQGLVQEAGSFGYLIAHPRHGRTGLQQFVEKIIDALPLRGIGRSPGRHPEDYDEALDGNFTIDGSRTSRAQARLIDFTLSTYFAPDELLASLATEEERTQVRKFLTFKKGDDENPVANAESFLLKKDSSKYRFLDPDGLWARYRWDAWKDSVTGKRVRNLTPISGLAPKENEKGAMRSLTPKEHQQAGHELQETVYGVRVYDFSGNFEKRMALLATLPSVQKMLAALVTEGATDQQRAEELALPSAVSINVSNNFGGQIYLIGHLPLIDRLPSSLRRIIAWHEYLHLKYPHWPESEVRQWADYKPVRDWVEWWRLLTAYVAGSLDSASQTLLNRWLEQIRVPEEELSRAESETLSAIQKAFDDTATFGQPKPFDEIRVVDTSYWVANSLNGDPHDFIHTVQLLEGDKKVLHVQKALLAELAHSQNEGNGLISAFVHHELHDEENFSITPELAHVANRAAERVVADLEERLDLPPLSARAMAGGWAVITGAGKELGSMIARVLAKGLGLNISLTGRDAEPLERTAQLLQGLGVRTRTLPSNVSSPKDVRWIHAVNPGSRVTINNAGVAGHIAPLSEVSLLDPVDQTNVNGWRSSFGINFSGVVLNLHQILTKPKPDSVVINISSWYRQNYRFFRAAYIVPKEMTAALSELMGPFLQRRGVSMVDVGPTLMDGPRFQTVVPGTEARLKKYGASDELIQTYLEAMVPGEVPSQLSIARTILAVLRDPLTWAGKSITAGRWTYQNRKARKDLAQLVADPSVSVRRGDRWPLSSLEGKRVLVTSVGDTQEILGSLREALESNGATVLVEDFGSKGVSEEKIQDVFQAAGSLQGVIHLTGKIDPGAQFIHELQQAGDKWPPTLESVAERVDRFERQYLTSSMLIAREASRQLEDGSNFVALNVPSYDTDPDRLSNGKGESYLLERGLKQLWRTLSAEHQMLSKLKDVRVYHVEPQGSVDPETLTRALVFRVGLHEIRRRSAPQNAINRVGLMGAATTTITTTIFGYVALNIFLDWNFGWLLTAGVTGAMLFATSAVLMNWPDSVAMRIFFSGPHELIAPLQVMKDVNEVAGGESVEFVSVRWPSPSERVLVVNKNRMRMVPPFLQWLFLTVLLASVHEWVHWKTPQLYPDNFLRAHLNEIPAYAAQILPIFLGAFLGDWAGLGAFSGALLTWAFTSIVVLVRVKEATDRLMLEPGRAATADSSIRSQLTTRATGPRDQRIDITRVNSSYEGLVYHAGEIMPQPGKALSAEAESLQKLLQAGERERPKFLWEKGIQGFFRMLRGYLLPTQTTAEIGAPSLVHVLPNLGARSRRYIDANGNIHLVFNQVYIETLLALLADPETRPMAEYLMARRLNRDMAQRRRIPTRRQELSYAVAGAERDYEQYVQLLSQPGLKEKLYAFLQTEKGQKLETLGEPYTGYMQVLQSWYEEKDKVKRWAMIEDYVQRTYRYDYVQMAPNRLAGQVVVVTGAGSGIGEAISQEAVKEGASVVITGRDTGKLRKALGVLASFILMLGTNASALSVSADVSSEADTEQVMKHTLDSLGRIDILVNNAGQSGPVRIHAHKNMKAFRENIDVHITGVWQNTMSAIRAGAKKVITVSTYFTEEHPKEQRPYRNRSDYTFAQGMKNRLAYLMALGNPDVKFVVSNPGPVHSDRIYTTVYPRNAEELTRLQNPVSEHIFIAAAGFLVRLMGDRDFDRKGLIQGAGLILRGMFALQRIPERLTGAKLAASGEGREILSDQRNLRKASALNLTSDQIEERLGRYFDVIYETARKIQRDTEGMIVDKRFLSGAEVAQEVIQLATPIGDQHNGQVVPIGGINYKPLLSSGVPMFRPQDRPSLQGKLAVVSLGYRLSDADIERLQLMLLSHLNAGARVVVMAPSHSKTIADQMLSQIASKYPLLKDRAEIMEVKLADERAVEDAFYRVTNKYQQKPDIVVHVTGDLDYTQNMETPTLDDVLTRQGWDALIDNYAMATGIVLKVAQNAMAPDALEEDPRLFKNAYGAITVIGPSLPTGAPFLTGNPKRDDKASEKEIARVEVIRGGLRPIVATINQEARIVKSHMWVNLVLPGRPDRKFAKAERTAATVLELSTRAGDETSFSGLILTPDETDAEIKLPEFPEPPAGPQVTGPDGNPTGGPTPDVVREPRIVLPNVSAHQGFLAWMRGAVAGFVPLASGLFFFPLEIGVFLKKVISRRWPAHSNHGSRTLYLQAA